MDKTKEYDEQLADKVKELVNAAEKAGVPLCVIAQVRMNGKKASSRASGFRFKPFEIFHGDVNENGALPVEIRAAVLVEDE